LQTNTRVMLVDDHAIVRSGFRRLLEQQGNCQVVAEAADVESAQNLFVEYDPDVVVLDLSLPGVSGLEAIRRITSLRPSARILVFSMHEDAVLAERAIQLGARGYVTKSSAPEVLASAVVEVMKGQLALSPDIAQALAILKVTGADNPTTTLTTREFEIFRMLAAGQTAGSIAELLRLSAKTVANYHYLIKQKLNVASDVELVLLAQRYSIG
jgi:two-component system, NarL family, invasion response regulator UvrY